MNLGHNLDNLNKIVRSVEAPTSLLAGVSGLATDAIKGFKKAGNKIFDTLSTDIGLGKATRLGNSDQLQAGLNGLGLKKKEENVKARFSMGTARDWRVKLSIPNTPSFQSGGAHLLQPLRATSGLVFPYTPTVIISHSANYNALAPTHSNYPFQAYSNSQVDQLVITGDFFVQNGIEAQYWVAALHYLRSCTKMFYGGNSKEQGAPPPVVFLTGYGDYVFDKVPVVITTFTVDMPDQVDYISTMVHAGSGKKLKGVRTQTDDGVQAGQFYGDTNLDSKFYTWAPTQSLISITCQPIYSRSQVAEFSLEKFVNGGYVGKGSTGFI